MLLGLSAGYSILMLKGSVVVNVVMFVNVMFTCIALGVLCDVVDGRFVCHVVEAKGLYKDV